MVWGVCKGVGGSKAGSLRELRGGLLTFCLKLSLETLGKLLASCYMGMALNYEGSCSCLGSCSLVRVGWWAGGETSWRDSFTGLLPHHPNTDRSLQDLCASGRCLGSLAEGTFTQHLFTDLLLYVRQLDWKSSWGRLYASLSFPSWGQKKVTEETKSWWFPALLIQ